MSRADFTVTGRAEDFAIKNRAYSRIERNILPDLRKSERERKKKREEEVAGERGGGGITKNATRIRWDPTPEREKRQELERGVREGERRRRRRGGRFDISLLTARF